MSILLDALRKSEQRERLGAVPDIHDSGPSSSDPERRRWIVPALAVIAIVIQYETLSITEIVAAQQGGWQNWTLFTNPVATAAAMLVEEVGRKSADPASFTQELLTRLSRERDENVDLLLGPAPGA